MNNELDNAGCSPKCPAHLTFGMDFCEISYCTACNIADDVSEIKREFAHPLYIEEVFSTIEIMQTQGKKKTDITLTEILNAIIKGENEFHMQYRNINIC